MTEQEWLTATDPAPMIRFLESKSPTAVPRSPIRDQNPGTLAEHLHEEQVARKTWRFCCYCAARDEHLGVPGLAEHRRRGIEATEAFLDGRLSEEEWWRENVDYLGTQHDHPTTLAAFLFFGWNSCFHAAITMSNAVCRGYVTHPTENYEDHLAALPLAEQTAKRAAEQLTRMALSLVLRCIFGNPFRPVTAHPSWLTSTVVALAAGIYDEKAFDRMPILADALQDAGCDNEDLLNHCREVEPHVRGCWVVDLLTGRK